MKFSKITFFSMLTFIILSVSSNVCHSQTKEYSGTVERHREAGMIFFYLNEKYGHHIFLGSVNDVESDKNKSCVIEGDELEKEIFIEGILEKSSPEGSYSTEYSFKDDKFICSSKKNVNAVEGLVGPKIFGLQLGMNRANADVVIKNLSSRFNLSSRELGGGEIWYHGPESPDDWFMTLRFDKDNILSFINLSSTFFGVDRLLTKEFLEIFVDKYKLPELNIKREYNRFTNYTSVSYVYNQPHEYFISIENGYITLQKDDSKKPILE